MDMIKIMYITKLKNKKTNGVTVAVTQLLNSLCKYSHIGWLNLSEGSFEVSEAVERLNLNSWSDFCPDIAVFEDPFNSLCFCKIAAELRKKRIPYIISPHGCFTQIAMQKKALKKYVAIHTVLRSFLKGSFATQYLCENEKKNSLCFGKSLIIPNGIPSVAVGKITQNIKKLVFISRKDVRHKGIDLLLEAVKQKKELFLLKNAVIDLYGPAESERDEDYINKLIQEGQLSEIVHNNSAVIGEEKVTVFENSDLFILTSRHEGFPMSILEALSYGLPVLITKGTNMADIVSEADAGWICETDIQDIAETLEIALNCTDCQQKSKNAQKLSARFSWDEVSSLTLKCYREIAK